MKMTKGSLTRSLWPSFSRHNFVIFFTLLYSLHSVTLSSNRITILTYLKPIRFHEAVPANIYLFKVNNWNIRKKCEISSVNKKIPE